MRVAAACLAFAAVAVSPERALGLSAPCAVVLDPATGAEVVSSAPDAPRPPASTTKLMTALLASERLDLDARLRVSARAAAMPRTKADLREGSSYRVRDLLRALLVGSSNDAAVVLAEGVSGSEAVFAELMTRRARSLGCARTRFENASGLTSPGQVSSCRDLLRIFAAVRESRLLMGILEDPSMTLAHPDGGRSTLRNHNKLLGDYPSAPVGKTGYTRAARHCFVGTFVREGREYHVACMGSGRLWDDLKALTGGPPPTRPAGPAASPERLKAVERALAKLGYRTGPADGTLDERSRAALLRFQRKRRLLADGVPRDATRKTLARMSGIVIP